MTQSNKCTCRDAVTLDTIRPPGVTRDLLPSDGDVCSDYFNPATGHVDTFRSALVHSDDRSVSWWVLEEVNSWDEGTCACGCEQGRFKCHDCRRYFAHGRYADKGNGKMRRMCFPCADSRDVGR